MNTAHTNAGLLLLLILSTPLAAETVYVKDVLYVPLRTGPTNAFRIIHKGLPSGTALEIIPGETAEDWLHVRAPNGMEGWFPEQYTQKEPAAADQLSKALSELSQLQAQCRDQSTNLKQTSGELNAVQENLEANKKKVEELSSELNQIRKISASAIELDKNYRKLLEQQELLQTENDTLLAENSNLRNDRRLSFMVYGAGLLFGGMLLTLIVQRFKPRRRSSEWRN